MANKHQLTIYLIDGSKETYTFVSENHIDSIKNELLREVANESALSLMTEDVSNVADWNESHASFISVTTS